MANTRDITQGHNVWPRPRKTTQGHFQETLPRDTFQLHYLGKLPTMATLPRDTILWTLPTELYIWSINFKCPIYGRYIGRQPRDIIKGTQPRDTIPKTLPTVGTLHYSMGTTDKTLSLDTTQGHYLKTLPTVGTLYGCHLWPLWMDTTQKDNLDNPKGHYLGLLSRYTTYLPQVHQVWGLSMSLTLSMDTTQVFNLAVLSWDAGKTNWRSFQETLHRTIIWVHYLATISTLLSNHRYTIDVHYVQTISRKTSQRRFQETRHRATIWVDQLFITFKLIYKT